MRDFPLVIFSHPVPCNNECVRVHFGCSCNNTALRNKCCVGSGINIIPTLSLQFQLKIMQEFSFTSSISS